MTDYSIEYQVSFLLSHLLYLLGMEIDFLKLPDAKRSRYVLMFKNVVNGKENFLLLECSK